MHEIWKDIKNYVGIYQISSQGRVRSFKGNEKILKGSSGKGRYVEICLFKEGKGKRFSVHRLVGEYFMKKSPSMLIINHINSIKSDNRVENLEWCTYSHNTKHSFRVGGRSCSKNNFFRTHKGALERKAVIQYKNTGELIAEYRSQHKASKATGISQASISQCCRGRTKYAGGFIWKTK